MKLTVLMPCLNEAETLGTCVSKARSWIESAEIEAEVVVADNGSTDGSQQIARDNGARVVDVEERGYGSALFHGSQAARGQYIVMGDADDSYDFSRLDDFVSELDQGHDLVMGNRFVGGIAPGAMPWKNRYIGNPVLSMIGRVLFRVPVGDFHCGIRGFRKDAFEQMDLRTTGMEFASEMVIKATMLNMRVTEVPTTLSPDGRSRPPHLRPWRDGWRHLRFMLLLSPKWLFLIPGLSLLIPTLIAYVALLFGPVKVGSVTFDINTLFLAQAGVVLGFSTVMLGVVVRMFAMREGLLRSHALLDAARRSPILEIGGVVGILLVLLGVASGLVMVGRWGSHDFGPLPAGDLLRWASATSAITILGGLVFLFSLIMGFLALPTRHERVAA